MSDLKGRTGGPSYGEDQEMCDHITIANFSPRPDSTFPSHEYASVVEVRCEECDETYEIEVLVN